VREGEEVRVFIEDGHAYVTHIKITDGERIIDLEVFDKDKMEDVYGRLREIVKKGESGGRQDVRGEGRKFRGKGKRTGRKA
jgi:hypothetical protein